MNLIAQSLLLDSHELPMEQLEQEARHIAERRIEQEGWKFDEIKISFLGSLTNYLSPKTPTRMYVIDYLIEEKKITITPSQAVEALRQYETTSGNDNDRLAAYYMALGISIDDFNTEEKE